MKAIGLIIPNSEFDLTLKSYYLDKQNWQKSKLLLQEISDDAKKKNIQLIVLTFPEINLLEHSGLFVKTEKIIGDFYKQSPSVTYVNGFDLFNGEHAKDYMLSNTTAIQMKKHTKKWPSQYLNLSFLLPNKKVAVGFASGSIDHFFLKDEMYAQNYQPAFYFLCEF